MKLIKLFIISCLIFVWMISSSIFVVGLERFEEKLVLSVWLFVTIIFVYSIVWTIKANKINKPNLKIIK